MCVYIYTHIHTHYIYIYRYIHTHTHTHTILGDKCYIIGLPRDSVVKNLPANAGRKCKRLEFNPWVGKAAWKRKWQPTAAFLPGKSHGPRRLVDYSPWVTKSHT